jgi:site-specific recombinase XerC
MPTSVETYAPDALASLRESSALHLEATRQPKTTQIYLSALDGLIAHLAANGMPTNARAVRPEHMESWMAARRVKVKPATLSIEYRALAKFWRWAVEEEEVDRAPMEKIQPPIVPITPVPVISTADFKRSLRPATARTSTRSGMPRSCSTSMTPALGCLRWP